MDIYQIRLHNLRKLVYEYNGQKNFSEAADIATNQLNHIVGPNPIRNVGEKLARKIEKNLNLEDRYLDKKHKDNLDNTQDDIIINRKIKVISNTQSFKFKDSKQSIVFSNECLKKCNLPKTIVEFEYTQNNMSPCILAGDILAINPEENVLQDGKPFLILFNNKLVIYRIFKQLNETIIFSNDNKENALYHDLVATTEQLKKIKILGSVIALFRNTI